jgi:cytochrome o ubiquinol oxidase subunit 3
MECSTLVVLEDRQLKSFSSSLLLAVNAQKRSLALLLFGLTFLLGVSFLTLELTEFAHFVHEGASWTRSGFLSAFFTLVGTHGAHITVGLFWMALMMFQLMRQGINIHVYRRINCLSLFWHFLDLVWIFIFTLVYLFGVIW